MCECVGKKREKRLDVEPLSIANLGRNCLLNLHHNLLTVCLNNEPNCSSFEFKNGLSMWEGFDKRNNPICTEHVIANVFDTIFVSIKELCTLGVIDETRHTSGATVACNIVDLGHVVEALRESVGEFVSVEKHVIEGKEHIASEDYRKARRL